MSTHVGESIEWTLRGFQNPTNRSVANFGIVDMPGRGLNFHSGRLPAFTNGAGITYEIRYAVAGSDDWVVLATGIDASRPHTFQLPQPGNIHYSAIGFFFGTVPAGFGMNNEIVLTFVVGNDAPNNLLVNNFWITYEGIVQHGASPYRPIVVVPPTVTTPPTTHVPNHTLPANQPGPDTVQVGRMPQTGLMGHALWLGSALLLATSAGLGTMSYMKARKRKRKGTMK